MALEAGNLFLSRSRNHASFRNPIHDERSWREHRDEAYRKLNLPTEARSFLECIATALDRATASQKSRTVRGGRDPIDHASGGNDDLANAVAGALLLCERADRLSRAPDWVGDCTDFGMRFMWQ